jgi:hypothetical protein
MTKHHSRRRHSRYDLTHNGHVPGPRVHLGAVLKASYDDESPRWIEKMKRKGFMLDTNLSDVHSKVWIRPSDRKAIFTVAGTGLTHHKDHRKFDSADIQTDLAFASGGDAALKHTNRYKQSANTLEKARSKYKDFNFQFAGHSLGGAITSALARPDETVHTYGRAATFGTRVKDNENAFRTSGDIFSANAIGAQTLPQIHGWYGVNSHDISNLRGVPLFL